MVEVYLRSRAVKRKRVGGRKATRSLYLDIYYGWDPAYGRYRRKTERLGLYLIGERYEDKESTKRAEELRLARWRELNQGEGDVRERRRDSFIDYVREVADTKSGSTKKSWLVAAKHLAACFPGGLIFAGLSRRTLDEFRRHLLETLGQASSAALYLGHVKAAIRSAVDDNILPFDPSRKVKIKAHRRLPTHFSLEELSRLEQTPCAREEVKRAFLFSAFSGLRISDVERLKWADVDLNEKNIEFVQKKTGVSEHLPLGDQATEVLETQKRTGEPQVLVFALPHRATVDKILKQWAKAAGIDKPMSFHKARHSFAVLAISSGVDLYTLSTLLGHSSISMTQLYAKAVGEQKKKAIGMLPTFPHKRLDSALQP